VAVKVGVVIVPDVEATSVPVGKSGLGGAELPLPSTEALASGAKRAMASKHTRVAGTRVVLILFSKVISRGSKAAMQLFCYFEQKRTYPKRNPATPGRVTTEQN
jgi:hypothetical protein